MNGNGRSIDTSIPDVRLRIYRPGYALDTLVLSHDGTSFHCHIRMSCAEAKMLSQKVVIHALRAEDDVPSGDEPDEIINNEKGLLTVTRKCFDSRTVEIRYDSQQIHCYFEFSASLAKIFSRAVAAIAEEAELYVSKMGGAA